MANRSPHGPWRWRLWRFILSCCARSGSLKVSDHWLKEQRRTEAGGGWRHGVHIWLTSEADERDKAERRQRFQVWRENKREHRKRA